MVRRRRCRCSCGLGGSGGSRFGQGTTITPGFSELGGFVFCEEMGGSGGSYDFDGAVPRAGAKRVLCDEVPVYGEDLALMLLPGLHGEFVQGDVEEFDGAVAGGDDDLVLVRFRPSQIVQGVLGVEPFFFWYM